MNKLDRLRGARVPVELVDAAEGRVRYRFPCGHTRTEVLLIGPTTGPGARRMQRPMAPDLLRKLVPYWNQNGGLKVQPCRRCSKQAAITSMQQESSS